MAPPNSDAHRSILKYTNARLLGRFILVVEIKPFLINAPNDESSCELFSTPPPNKFCFLMCDSCSPPNHSPQWTVDLLVMAQQVWMHVPPWTTFVLEWHNFLSLLNHKFSGEALFPIPERNYADKIRQIRCSINSYTAPFKGTKRRARKEMAQKMLSWKIYERTKIQKR